MAEVETLRVEFPKLKRFCNKCGKEMFFGMNEKPTFYCGKPCSKSASQEVIRRTEKLNNLGYKLPTKSEKAEEGKANE